VAGTTDTTDTTAAAGPRCLGVPAAVPANRQLSSEKLACLTCGCPWIRKKTKEAVGPGRLFFKVRKRRSLKSRTRKNPTE